MDLGEKKKFIINFIYFAVWAVIIYLLFKAAAVYLFPFLIGIIIAYAVQKPAVYLSQKIKIKKQNCAAALSFVIYVAVLILISIICWILYLQLSKLMGYISHNGNVIMQYIEGFYEHIENVFNKIGLNGTFKKFSDDAIGDIIKKVSVFLSNAVTSLVKSLPALLINCIVTVVATCYISKDYERLLKFIKGFLSKENYNRIIDIKNIFSECFLKLLTGYFWLFIITFLQLLFGFLLLGIRRFITLAFLVALVDLLPVFGTGTVLIPWSVIAVLQNDYKTGFGILAIYIVITVIKNFAEPKIIGKQIGINPIFMLVFIFLGLRLGGIIGMLVLPVILTVLFTYYRRIYSDNI